ncbi:hypothetical protein ROA7450_00577 [Roseovarius albus]|uniref:Uncharacterized protein n=1 Tax=Roseovarius albus TaxID=1247867 RepID=A0A1X6YEP1_9RHOB|nr:hypothetical protein ROA7450_00577 [Roseovarius albus]
MFRLIRLVFLCFFAFIAGVFFERNGQKEQCASTGGDWSDGYCVAGAS